MSPTPPEAPTDLIRGSFVLSRRFDAAPARVFAAFSSEPLRRRWFRLPGKSTRYTLDFSVGGGEEARSVFPTADGSEDLAYASRFVDIVPDSRIVTNYEVSLNGQRRWTSLVAVELIPSEGGATTTVTWTELYIFLAFTGDGTEDRAHLRGSTPLAFNALAAALKTATAATDAA
jgi:uncharacterized protein YndB with AHSA1/START domain